MNSAPHARALPLGDALAIALSLAACNDQLGYWSFPRDGGVVAESPGARAAPPAVNAPPPSAAAGSGAVMVSLPPTPCGGFTAGFACRLAGGSSLPADATVSAFNTTTYFADGAPLPAGRYRIAYSDGCVKVALPALAEISTAELFGWTVHLSEPLDETGVGTCWLVGDDDIKLSRVPGTAGIISGFGTFPTYADCVSANCAQPAIDFDFAGGRIGLRAPIAEASTFVAASSEGGRGPTFRLSRIDPCP